MREQEEPNWFARWEEQLPSLEELMPLSQTLITPDLAIAFDIPTIRSNPNPNPSLHHHYSAPNLHPPPPATSSQPSPDFDSPDHLTTASSGGGAAGGSAGEEPARTLKRPRLVWTPQLHKRFVDAVAHLGIKNAVPKTIMQLMSVDGLTRENVASHLQKYRLYLKRMQGLNSSGGGGGGGPGGGAGGPISAADAATDQLFASSSIPHQFLGRGPGPERFMPFVPVAALQHHQQITAAMQQQHQQQQYYQQRHMGHFGSPTGGSEGYDHGFLARTVPQPGMHRMVGPVAVGLVPPPPPSAPSAALYVEDLESGSRRGGGERRMLTLFPTAED